MSLTLTQKAFHAGVSAAIFLAVSLPYVYDKTNSVLFSSPGTCPTYKSKLLHAVLFVAIAFLVMKYLVDVSGSNGMLLRYAIYGALVFFLVSSTEMYTLTHGIYDGITVDNGCPTLTAVVIHTVVYFLILVGMMSLPL